MIKTALIGLLGVLTFVVTAACANEAATVEVTHFEADTEAVRAVRVQGEPPQLVTETWLRRQLDISIAKLWAIPIAEALAGPAHRFTSRVVDVDADTWDDDHQVHLTVDPQRRAGPPAPRADDVHLRRLRLRQGVGLG